MSCGCLPCLRVPCQWPYAHRLIEEGKHDELRGYLSKVDRGGRGDKPGGASSSASADGTMLHAFAFESLLSKAIDADGAECLLVLLQAHSRFQPDDSQRRRRTLAAVTRSFFRNADPVWRSKHSGRRAEAHLRRSHDF